MPADMSDEVHAASSSASRLKRVVSSAYLSALSRASSEDDDVTPLPRMQVFIVFINQMNVGVNVMMPFTLLVYIVREMDISQGGDPALVGKYTGYLSCLYSFGMMLTSVPWGRASDRYGRKPVVLAACLTSAVGGVGLGMAETYVVACLVRVVAGLCNGVIGAIKCICAEITDHTNQARGFSLISLAWGIGSITGPTLAGLLADPCSRYLEGTSWCEDGAAFKERKYLLACLAMALHSTITFFLTLFFLQETLDPSVLAGGAGAAGAAGEAGAGEAEAETRGLLEDDEEEGGGGGGVIVSNKDLTPDFVELELTPLKEPEGGHMEVVELEMGALGGGGGGGGGVGKAAWEGEELGLLRPSPPAPSPLRPPPTPAGGNGGGGGGDGGAGAEEGGWKARFLPAWWHYPHVPEVIAGYGMIAFLFILVDEVVPIFAASSKEVGGLDLPTSELAAPLSMGGAFLFTYTILFFPATERRYGAITLARWGAFITSFVILLFPTCSLIQRIHPGVARVMFFVVICLKNLGAINLFTPSIILVNAAAPPGRIGEINGVGQTCAAMVRAFGPALGGAVWGYSTRLAFRGHQFVVFSIMSLTALALLGHYSLPWAAALQGRILESRRKPGEGSPAK